jgi:multiple sugar transport system substrate-binding protein
VKPDSPATHAELIQVASEISAEHGLDGFLFNGGRWEATTFDNLAHFWAAGGDLVDDEGRPIFGEGEHRDALITTFEFLRQAVEDGASPEAVATIMEYEEFNTAAQAGTVASFLGGHWQYGQLMDILDEDEFALWDFAPIPTPEDGQHTTGTGGWTFGVFSEEPEIQAACMDFVRSVYYGPANVVANQLPTSTSLYDEYDEFDAEHYERFNELLEDGRARPGVPVYSEISEHLQVAIGELLIGNLTPEQAVDQAYEAALDAYESL